jgi:hypothetical protein
MTLFCAAMGEWMGEYAVDLPRHTARQLRRFQASHRRCIPVALKTPVGLLTPLTYGDEPSCGTSTGRAPPRAVTTAPAYLTTTTTQAATCYGGECDNPA